MYPSTDEIAAMTVSQMVASYNELSPGTAVKKFETKAVGIKRLSAVIAMRQADDARAVQVETPRAAAVGIEDWPVRAEPTVNEEAIEEIFADESFDAKANERAQVDPELIAGDVEELAAKPVAEIVKVLKDRKTISKTTTVRGGKPTISSRCFELIDAGKTDAEIWAIIQPEFGLSDNKKNYPKLNRQHYAKKHGV